MRVEGATDKGGAERTARESAGVTCGVSDKEEFCTSQEKEIIKRTVLVNSCVDFIIMIILLSSRIQTLWILIVFKSLKMIAL